METQDTQAQEPVPNPVPNPAPPVPSPPLVVPAQSAPAPAPVDPPARRRGRTALIVAAAAVVGIVGGTAVGYGVQADREPTPLPALSRPELAYPAKPLPGGARPVPLSAAEDHQVRTDGDLRKLVLAKPSGARRVDGMGPDGWMDLAFYSLEFESEDHMFEMFLESDLRRVAGAAWEQGEHKRTAIRLVQFRTGQEAGELASDQRSYMPYDDEHGAGNHGDPLKGSKEGRYYLYKVSEKAGYLPAYKARAVFHRGDIMVDISIYDTKRITKNDIRSLAERQLERL
ncbi:hypothetical protein ACFU5O_34515 [Streptomyces sp. NPDC057445]|uniref:hypothetical protein n=1 Tax=Streptomyces sp. NPDC057445 TaxID=3346136 RepID=UPI0036943AAF